MWRKALGILGSLVKGLVAFIEHLLYVMRYLRCLADTPSLVLTTTLGNKYSYLVLPMKKLRLTEIKG